MGFEFSEPPLGTDSTRVTRPCSNGAARELDYPAAPVDLSAYSGLVFWGMAAKEAGATNVLVQFQDSNTDPRGEICDPVPGSADECYNGFGVVLELGDEFTRYEVDFAELEQNPLWGYHPKPSIFDREHVYGLVFQIDTPGGVCLPPIVCLGGPPKLTFDVSDRRSVFRKTLVWAAALEDSRVSAGNAAARRVLRGRPADMSAWMFAPSERVRRVHEWPDTIARDREIDGNRARHTRCTAVATPCARSPLRRSSCSLPLSPTRKRKADRMIPRHSILLRSRPLPPPLPRLPLPTLLPLFRPLPTQHPLPHPLPLPPRHQKLRRRRCARPRRPSSPAAPLRATRKPNRAGSSATTATCALRCASASASGCRKTRTATRSRTRPTRRFTKRRSPTIST